MLRRAGDGVRLQPVAVRLGRPRVRVRGLMVAPDRVLVSVPVILPPEMTSDAFRYYRLVPGQAPILLIDNTAGSTYLARYERDLRFEVVCHRENAGVARSWNEALARGADLTLLLSSSVVLPRGLPEVVRLVAESTDEFGCLTMLGLHAAAWTPAVVERVGLFDENLWPAYWEDSDFLYRLRLADVHGGVSGRCLPKVAILGATTEYGRGKTYLDGLYSHRFDYNIGLRYFCAKWQGPPGEEGYTTPFGLPDRPLSWWPQAPIAEEQRMQHERGAGRYRLPDLSI